MEENLHVKRVNIYLVFLYVESKNITFTGLNKRKCVFTISVFEPVGLQ